MFISHQSLSFQEFIFTSYDKLSNWGHLMRGMIFIHLFLINTPLTRKKASKEYPDLKLIQFQVSKMRR